MKHKWHKEIIHWANGGEVESRSTVDYALYQEDWSLDKEPFWYADELEFRIKPQPKEPQYLYVLLAKHSGKFELSQVPIECHPQNAFVYIGKIKLEVDDE